MMPNRYVFPGPFARMTWSSCPDFRHSQHWICRESENAWDGNCSLMNWIRLVNSVRFNTLLTLHYTRRNFPQSFHALFLVCLFFLTARAAWKMQDWSSNLIYCLFGMPFRVSLPRLSLIQKLRTIYGGQGCGMRVISLSHAKKAIEAWPICIMFVRWCNISQRICGE